MIARKKAARSAKLSAQAAEGTSRTHYSFINKMPFDFLYTDLHALHSPYCTKPWTLLIGPHQTSYTVLHGILSKYPQLMGNPGWSCTVELPEVCEDAGHTLIHYLHTGTYETLQSRDGDDKTAELRKDAHLYGIATKYDLPGLKSIAQQNIEIKQGAVAIIDVLDLAKDVFQILPETGDWFTLHVKMEIEAALEVDEFLFGKTDFLELVGQVKSFDRFLMEIVGKVYIDNIAIMARKTHSPTNRPSINVVYTPEYSSLSTEETSHGDLKSEGLRESTSLGDPGVCDETFPYE